MAGVLLGPSAFGAIPGFTSTLFPDDSLEPLTLTAHLGLILWDIIFNFLEAFCVVRVCVCMICVCVLSIKCFLFLPDSVRVVFSRPCVLYVYAYVYV